MKERKYSLDYLKFISCLFVIIIHVSSGYISNNIQENNFNFIIANIFDSFSRIAVPIFLMISGLFNIKNKENAESNKYYAKINKEYTFPLIAYNFLYFLYVILKKYFVYGSFQIKNVSFEIFRTGTTFYHLWYLNMIIFIYLLTPFIIKYKNKVGEKIFLYTAIAILITEMIVSYMLEYNIFWLYKFLIYLGYYMIGYSVGNRVELLKSLSKKKLIYLYIGMSFLIFLLTQLSIMNKEIGYEKLKYYEIMNPLVVVAAISVYLLFLKIDMKKNKFINFIKDNLFQIYLLHALIIDLLNGVKKILKRDDMAILMIPLEVIFVLAISLIISLCISKLKIKVLKKIEKRGNNE